MKNLNSKTIIEHLNSIHCPWLLTSNSPAKLSCPCNECGVFKSTRISVIDEIFTSFKVTIFHDPCVANLQDFDLHKAIQFCEPCQIKPESAPILSKFIDDSTRDCKTANNAELAEFFSKLEIIPTFSGKYVSLTSKPSILHEFISDELLSKIPEVQDYVLGHAVANIKRLIHPEFFESAESTLKIVQPFLNSISTVALTLDAAMPFVDHEILKGTKFPTMNAPGVYLAPTIDNKRLAPLAGFECADDVFLDRECSILLIPHIPKVPLKKSIFAHLNDHDIANDLLDYASKLHEVSFYAGE